MNSEEPQLLEHHIVAYIWTSRRRPSILQGEERCGWFACL